MFWAIFFISHKKHKKLFWNQAKNYSAQKIIPRFLLLSGVPSCESASGKTLVRYKTRKLAAFQIDFIINSGRATLFISYPKSTKRARWPYFYFTPHFIFTREAEIQILRVPPIKSAARGDEKSLGNAGPKCAISILRFFTTRRAGAAASESKWDEI